jgi:DNA-directed RNA polymerase subunit RPC12/RpoP
MQEDFLGTRRAVISSTLIVQCARCGKPTPRNQAKIIQSSIMSDSNSEFEYICYECQKRQAKDADDLPIEQ